MHGWMMPNGGWMMQGGFWWMGLIMMLIQLLFWGAIIYFVAKLIKNAINKPTAPGKEDDHAMTILRERYAKGEIELEEFNSRKNELIK